MLARSVLVLVVLFTVSACSPGGSQPSGPDLGGAADPDPTVAEGTGSPTGATTTASEDPATPGGADTETADSTPVEDLAVGYLTALASADPARRQDAVDATAAGSPAHAYARFQVAQARAIREQELEQPDAEVRRSADGIALCYGEQCATYRAFVAEGEPARLVTFDIEGRPVGERVAASDDVDPVTLGPATVRLVGALQAATEESTVVVFEVHNGGDVRLDLPLYLSEYGAPGGQSRPVRDAIGPGELASDATTTVVLVFERTGFGGTLRLEASTDEDRYEATIRIPTP